jgi:hypothetical protein
LACIAREVNKLKAEGDILKKRGPSSRGRLHEVRLRREAPEHLAGAPSLCVPKIRFCNIDGEGRQRQVVRRRRRGAQSRDGEGRPCSEIDGSSKAISYGKAAIVGTSGDIEHAAAILHPRMGKPMRDAIGGGQAIIPSNVKIGAVGCSIDVPLGHKDDVWAFDQIDTLGVTVANAPRPDEIVVIVALADGGRPRPRIAKSGAVTPRAPR